MAPAAVAPTLSPLLKDALYWRGEAERAFRERDEVKRSLAAADGPAAYWRDQAKDIAKRLKDAQGRVEGLRRGEHEQRIQAIRFSEEADALKRSIGAVKEQLWTIWSALDDTDPTKQQLWDVWAAL